MNIVIKIIVSAVIALIASVLTVTYLNGEIVNTAFDMIVFTIFFVAVLAGSVLSNLIAPGQATEAPTSGKPEARANQQHAKQQPQQKNAGNKSKSTGGKPQQQKAREKAVTEPASPKVVPEGPREQGEVKWFNGAKGYGFIIRENGEEIFVHYRSIRGSGRRSLFDGQQVEFVVTTGDKGLQAEDVEALDS